MKICAAQTRSIKGDIESNIANHIIQINMAVDEGADLIIFPELSLTGYEPSLANKLAFTKNDNRIDVFQNISNVCNITIGVGAPVKNNNGICISMIIFQPHIARQTYSKKYIHPDEEPFFVPGENFPVLDVKKKNIALAICYELSIPEHSENAFNNGAEIYLASAAKTADGMKKAGAALSEIARRYSIPVLISNSIGQSDDFISAGSSAVWSNNGDLAGQLNNTNEGILLYDTVTQEIIIKII